MSKYTKFFLFFFILSLVFILLFKAGLKEAPKDSYQQTEKTDMPTETERRDGLPQALPRDFPIFDELDLIEVSETEENNKESISILWETKTPSKSLFEFYTRELKKRGWEVKSLLQSDNSYTLSFEKDNVSGFLGLTKKDSETTALSVTMGSE